MTDFYEPPHCPESPGLQPIRPNFHPAESPETYITESISSSEAEEESGGRRRSGRGPRPSLGDVVLLNQLAPNQPEVADWAGKNPLNPTSPTSTAPSTESVRGDMVTETTEDETLNAQTVAKTALKLGVRGSIGPSIPHIMDHKLPRDSKPPDPSTSMKRLSPRPPRLLPRPIKTEPGDHLDEDTSAISPNLAKYTITPSEPIASTLPALQTSPGRPNSIQSPANTQNLPSLKTALGDQLPDSNMTGGIVSAFPPIIRDSPTMTRATTAYMAPVSGPSPGTFSQASPASSKDLPTISPPASQASHPSYWRTGPKSEASMGSVISDSTTPSTVSHSSPGSAFTPGHPENRAAAETDASNLINGPMPPNGPFTSSAFKCTFPGCTAQPFQTQYLLNSHANVHSSNRPHYCPVKDCPRGIGGKGFKRKNEMIRHGLVHESPGYVCPFCPEQQHRYPRPDNLQRYIFIISRVHLLLFADNAYYRHVRVHHVDKDKEDPVLREVLAQRPEGPNRGRRRRLGS